jgi:hypothetical protein
LGSDGQYEVERTYEKLGRVESRVLEGFVLDVADLWPA